MKWYLLLAISTITIASLSAGPQRSAPKNAYQKAAPERLATIHLIDRNGMAEIVRDKKRLSQFEKIDFSSPQPYQKVLRLFEKDKVGHCRSLITSYHDNGHLKQYLEALDNRAMGVYREWFGNGQLKVDSFVISGVADLHPKAEESWLFDGVSRAFNEQGSLLAQILYNRGELEGEAYYYHKNGQLSRRITYHHNRPEGVQQSYNERGELTAEIPFREGQRDGIAVSYWSAAFVASKEHYIQGKLIEGSYFDPTGAQIATIHEGSGYKAIFSDHELAELHEYKNGTPEGTVECFKEKMRTSIYRIKEGQKEGEEIRYFPKSSVARLLLTWRQGMLQGLSKTWYATGALESQKEISQNKKNGTSFAWYPSGNLMFVEEYEQDKLIRGEYYRMGEKVPLSTVEHGKGVATLFDSTGQLLHKIHYSDGKVDSL